MPFDNLAFDPNLTFDPVLGPKQDRVGGGQVQQYLQLLGVLLQSVHVGQRGDPVVGKVDAWDQVVVLAAQVTNLRGRKRSCC